MYPTLNMASLKEKEKILQDEIEKFKDIQKGTKKNKEKHTLITLIFRYTKMCVEEKTIGGTIDREQDSQRGMATQYS